MKPYVRCTLFAFALALALPCAAEVSVVGCIFDSTNPQINDDPNRCPADRKLDIVSIKTSWTQSSTVGGGGGGGAGKVQVGPFLISKNLDRTSPGLFLDVVTGRHLRGVLIAVFDSGPRGGGLRRVFSFLLQDVLVSSLEFDASDSRARGATPVDLVGFSYARLTIRDDVSGLSTTFDFAQNRTE
jgi:type VI protein secretion system component Hcp